MKNLRSVQKPEKRSKKPKLEYDSNLMSRKNFNNIWIWR